MRLAWIRLALLSTTLSAIPTTVTQPLHAEDADGASQRLIANYQAGRVTTSEGLTEVAMALVQLGREDPQRFRDALRVYDEAIAADPSNLDAQVALGDLFLAKYNGQSARETYARVLEQEPEHASALLGMAKVQRFDGATDVFDLTEASLKQNPDFLPARLFQARLHLDLEDYSAADREAEKALEIDAQSAQAHALLTATALLSGNPAEYQRRLEKLELVAAGDPDVYITLAEVAARSRLYQQAAGFADRAIQIDAKAWRGYALRGINRLRLGDIDAGRTDLETSFAGDPFDVWTKNTLDLFDGVATYETRPTEHFELVIPATEADLLSLYLGPLAEEAHDQLAGHYGVTLPPPVRIEVYTRHADFSVRTIGLAGLGALGVSFGPVVAIDAPSARPAGDFHWGTTLWHELAHSFHMRLSAHRVPRWFTEGLAVFEERRAYPGWGDGVGPELLIAYKRGLLAPVEDLNQGFMRPAYPQQIIFSYIQSSLVFDYITSRWSFTAVVDMLRGYRDGGDTQGVFEQVLKIELEKFAADFDAYFQQRFAGPLASLKIPDDEAPPPSSAELRRRAESDTDDFLAQLSRGQSLMEDDPEAALVHLERARDLFPEYVGSASPYWLLAQVHHQAGRMKEALAEASALTLRNRSHYPALRMLAELHAEAGDTAAAALAIKDAQFIYPYEPDDHRRLAEWSKASGRLDDAVRERRAILALNPVNRSRALYELARDLHASGDRKAARSAVLEALEQAPNYDDALTLLLELRAAAGGSP